MPARRTEFGHPELAPLRTLDTPAKIQDFVNAIRVNHERGGETCTSPVVTLRRNRAHCMEGALVAALALWIHGEPPLILDLRSAHDDVDHLVTLVRVDGRWGGITKTSHAVLRYREPIYRDVRELAMSYFHEYFLDTGKKTLRQYSSPFDLRKWKGDWIATEDDLWELERAIDRSPHHDLLTSAQMRRLRLADAIEIRAGKLRER
ncbi:MAG TPA: hypothetical protein VGM50_20040 [Gemmatimonadaceae bacterium]|jgi:hypothetical protein